MRRAIVAVAFAVVSLSVCAPLAAAQTNLYFWCWAAQLTRDASNNENWYYSDVFSSVKPQTQLSAAYGKFVHATYPNDLKATGIGNGECRSYKTQAAAEASLNTAKQAQSETNSLVATHWSGGKQVSSPAAYPTFCSNSASDNAWTGYFTDVFTTTKDTADLTNAFGSYLKQTYPTITRLAPECVYGGPGGNDASGVRKMRIEECESVSVVASAGPHKCVEIHWKY
jgi:hypothetical protein